MTGCSETGGGPLERIARRLPDDPGHGALEAAVRLAVVAMAVFAFAALALDNSVIALFGIFGVFAMLVFAQFGGPPRRQLRAYLLLVAAGFPLIALGTVCSQSSWAAGGTMAAVAFAILFAGILDGYIAAATNAALLAFVLAVMVAAPTSEIPDRLAGWALAGAVSTAAVMLVWPNRTHGRLRVLGAAACRALAGYVEALSGGEQSVIRARYDDAVEAMVALRSRFMSLPRRPTGAIGPTAALARMVADVGWLRPFLRSRPGAPLETSSFPTEAAQICAVSAEVLEASATRLERGSATPDIDRLDRVREAAGESFSEHILAAIATRADSTLTASLDEAFRLRLLSYGVRQIAVDAMAASGEPVTDPLEEEIASLPRRRRGPLMQAIEAAKQFAGGHVTTESVWFRNSVRGAVGLSLAVLIGHLAELQHGFWVVLGTLSVLRSNALSTGSTVLRALAGTAVGIVVAAALIAAIDSDEVVLWSVLPLVLLIAGYAPRAISFAAGQASFTVAILIVFDLIQPAGWQVGLVRVEDIAIGCAISLGVGLLFWPRGAAGVVRHSIATAYGRAVDYLSVTVTCLLEGRGQERMRAAAQASIGANRRLDDAVRQYLAERSTRGLKLESLGPLVAGAARVRRAADLLQSGHVLYRLRPLTEAESTPALASSRRALDAEIESLGAWYRELGDAVVAATEPPPPQPPEAGSRIAGWERDTAVSGRGTSLPPGLAIAWTSEHIDTLRVLQPLLAEAAAGLARDAEPGAGGDGGDPHHPVAPG